MLELLTLVLTPFQELKCKFTIKIIIITNPFLYKFFFTSKNLENLNKNYKKLIGLMNLFFFKILLKLLYIFYYY